MHFDAGALQDFYRSPLGTMVRRRIGRQVAKMWRGEGAREAAIGFGFAMPYMSSLKACQRIGVLIPEQFGALRWPAEGPAQTALVQEERLPLADNSVDRLLVAHGLEVAHHARALLRELWRVLTPDGRILLIVPNRRGVWSRFEHTPFGHGHPYSRGQLGQVLTDAMFRPLRWESALYFPPLQQRLLLRGATAVERAGHMATPAFAGVLLVEAEKQLIQPAKLARAKTVGLREFVTVRKDPSDF